MSEADKEQLKLVASFLVSMAIALLSLGILVPILVAQIGLFSSVQYPLCAFGALLLITAALNSSYHAHSVQPDRTETMMGHEAA